MINFREPCSDKLRVNISWGSDPQDKEGAPYSFPLVCSLLGAHQRVEAEQMLRDGGCSKAGLGGRMRAKDVLEQSPEGPGGGLCSAPASQVP